MKHFRYIFIISSLIIIGATFSIFKKEIGLGYIKGNSIIEFFVCLIFIISIIFLVTEIKNFNKQHFISYLTTFLSVCFFAIFTYSTGVTIKKHLYRYRISINYNPNDYEIINIPDKTSIEILSYTNAYDCTTERTYYYSVVCINKENYDTIRILTPCQLFSQIEQNATYNVHSKETEKILDSLRLNFNSNTQKFVLIDNEIPFQKGGYKVALGTISYDKSIDIFEENKIKN